MTATPGTLPDAPNHPVSQLIQVKSADNSLRTQPYPMTDEVIQLKTIAEVNDALAPILDGVIGFDMEFSQRKPTKEEIIIDNLFKRVGGNRKSMILAWQVIQQNSTSFCIEWDNIAICTIQIARAQTVWVINLTLIRGQYFSNEPIDWRTENNKHSLPQRTGTYTGGKGHHKGRRGADDGHRLRMARPANGNGKHD